MPGYNKQQTADQVVDSVDPAGPSKPPLTLPACLRDRGPLPIRRGLRPGSCSFAVHRVDRTGQMLRLIARGADGRLVSAGDASALGRYGTMAVVREFQGFRLQALTPRSNC